MNTKLHINLKLLEHPYSYENGSEFEAWGQILMIVFDKSKPFILLDWQWNIIELVDWYIENREAICGESLLDVLQGENLAQALERLQARNFKEHEEELEYEWHTVLFEFRQQHSLRFALRGANIPNIIIGCNHGYGEISLVEGEKKWYYLFDFQDFCQNFENEMKQFLELWCNKLPNSKNIEYKNCLLTQIEEKNAQPS